MNRNLVFALIVVLSLIFITGLFSENVYAAPPVAVNDSYFIANPSYLNWNETLTVSAPGVLANDNDPDGDSLKAKIVINPAHGTVTLNPDGSFTYTSTNYIGEDSFTYKANDGVLDSNVATVNIKANRRPNAVDDRYVIRTNTILTIPAPGVLANDTDPDGDPLTVTKLRDPEHGTVTLNLNGSFTYTPDIDYYGLDYFYYVVSDGIFGGSGRVFINKGIPIAVNDSYAINMNTTLTLPAPGVLANDTDSDGDSLTAIKETGPANGTVTLNPDGSFRYRPNIDYYGTDSFKYKATDGFIDSYVATVNIAVNGPPIAVNDRYSCYKNSTLTIPYGNYYHIDSVLANDTDPYGIPLTAKKVTNPAHGTLTFNPDGSFTYTPDTGYVATDSFTYKVTDGILDSNVATVNIIVGYSSPRDDYYSVNMNTTLTSLSESPNYDRVLDNDDGVKYDGIAIKETDPAHGTVVLNPDGSFIYTPNPGYIGMDSFTYKDRVSGFGNVYSIRTSLDSTFAAKVSIKINGPPIAVNDNGTMIGNTFGNSGIFTEIDKSYMLNNDTDPNGDSLKVKIVTRPANGMLKDLEVSPNYKQSFTYTPNTGYAGTDSFTYVANDGMSDSNVATVNIRVLERPLPPVPVKDSYVMSMNTKLTVSAPGVLANDTDPNSDALEGAITTRQVTDPTYGKVILNRDGSFTYTPNTGYVGTDSFIYRSVKYVRSNEYSNQNLATVTITIVSLTALTKIQVEQNTVILTSEHLTERLRVYGENVEGLRIDITGANTGTTYKALKGYAVVHVDENGFATAMGVGRDIIEVKNGELTTTVIVSVQSFQPNTPPVADAGLDRTVGIGEIVQFDGTKSYDTDGSIVLYRWNFGDGTTGDGANVYYMFGKAGKYTVKLSVTDNRGAIATDTATIVVLVAQHILTTNVSPDGSGIMALSPPQPTGGYDEGTVVQLTANPNAELGFRFDHWSGDITGNTNPVSITMDSNKTVTANFVKTYSLATNVSPDGNGTVTLSPPQPVGGYDEGTVIQLTANPNAGWRFRAWSGSLIGNTNPLSITMDSNKTVTAYFMKIYYTLTTKVSLNGTGTVTLNPPQSAYGYDEGTVVQLTANPNAEIGFRFDRWSGDIIGNTNPVSITMDSNKTVTANFMKIYTLATSVSPTGSGTVTLNPPQPAGGYDESTVIQLTANPNAGWRFRAWSGSLSGNANPLSITMNSNKTATAYFVKAYTLTTNISPVGSGTVTLSPSQPNYGYDAGTWVRITANPAGGWRFSCWSGDIATYPYDLNQSTNINMNSDKTITANFVRYENYVLIIMYIDPVGSGTVTITPPQPTDGYSRDTVVQLTANPSSGWRFNNWGFNWDYRLSANSNPATITMNGANVKVVSARFVLNSSPIAVNDAYTTKQNTVLNVSASGVLSNDNDPNGDHLVAIKVSDPSHGTVALNSSGSFTYTPFLGYFGTDMFTYKVNDGDLYSSEATVVITVANTPVGESISVQLKDTTTMQKPVTLTFPEVTQAGVTELKTSSSGPEPPSGFTLACDPPVYYELTTTAIFSPSVTVCINYSGVSGVDESNLKLYHYENNQWVDTTTSLNTTNDIICGAVNSLSPFAIIKPPNQSPGGSYEISYPGEEGFFIGKPMIYKVVHNSKNEGDKGTEVTYIFGQNKASIDGKDYYDCFYRTASGDAHFILNIDKENKTVIQKSLKFGLTEINAETAVVILQYPLAAGKTWSGKTKLVASNIEIPGFGKLPELRIENVTAETKISSTTITTPAGTFDTLLVETNFTGLLLGTPMTLIQRTWMNEDNVPIKRNFEFTKPTSMLLYDFELFMPNPLVYDLNWDNVVNILDLVFVAKSLGTKITRPMIPNPDIDKSGVVDKLDLEAVALHFGQIYKPAAPQK